jgi:1-deoxy-D-xylulose-5-phosphate reductoisomerase
VNQPQISPPAFDGLVVLGATGSVGQQTIEAAGRLGIPIRALAAGRPSTALLQLAAAHPGAALAVAGGSGSEQRDFETAARRPVAFGTGAVTAMAATPSSIVMNGIVGAAGLSSTLAALDAGNLLGLANKESLVAGGPLVLKALARGGTLVPVDSEHSALHQLLADRSPSQIESIILTASGGPFRGRRREDLDDVTPEEALQHPTWRMGGRITVDSATLVNKGLEVLEAHVLFGVDFDRIEVVVHPQSLVHALVRLTDGALMAHIGHTDMRVPIQYALTYPDRADSGLEPFDLVGRRLDFEAPDLETFPALALAYAAGRRGGAMPAVYNAADEVAVAAFFQGRLGFTVIPMIIEATMTEMDGADATTLEEVLEVDAHARAVAASLIAGAW